MGSEGIPYKLETFTQLGVVADDSDMQDNSRILLPKAQEHPVVHAREFPVNNVAVTFPYPLRSKSLFGALGDRLRLCLACCLLTGN